MKKEKISLSQIRQDLRLIKEFYLYHSEMNKSEIKISTLIIGKVNTYNKLIKFTPIQLQYVYHNLYVLGLTQESLSDKMCYTRNYIYQLNIRLMKFFHTILNIKDFVV